MKKCLINKFVLIVIAIFCLTSLDGCKSKPASELNALQSERWVKDAIVYEVYLRSFSKEGTFKALEARLLELKNLGVTIISLMPIHPIGELNRRGKLGSPYAVKDFYTVNPEFGSIEDLTSLVSTAHRLDLKIIIEIVVSHAAWDSQLLMEHPDWFVHNEEGAIISPKADWIDVAQLDYNQHEPRKYMIAMMKYWINTTDIDGFKCAFSESVPIDFWSISRQELQKIKPIVLISDGNFPEYHLKSFDVTYSFDIGSLTREIIRRERSSTVIDDSLLIETSKYPKGAIHIRSKNPPHGNLETEMLIERPNPSVSKINSLLTFTLRGLPLIFNGEEVNNSKPLDLFNKVEIDWSQGLDIYPFYEKIIQFRKSHPALIDGEYVKISNNENSKVISFLRAINSDSVIVVANYSNENKVVKFKLEGSPNNIWMDLFSNIKYHTVDSLITIKILPMGYLILTQVKDGVK